MSQTQCLRSTIVFDPSLFIHWRFLNFHRIANGWMPRSSVLRNCSLRTWYYFTPTITIKSYLCLLSIIGFDPSLFIHWCSLNPELPSHCKWLDAAFVGLPKTPGSGLRPSNYPSNGIFDLDFGVFDPLLLAARPFSSPKLPSHREWLVLLKSTDIVLRTSH